MNAWVLTGKTRHTLVQVGLFWKRTFLVLQVELRPGPGEDCPGHFRQWRNATVEDLEALK